MNSNDYENDIPLDLARAAHQGTSFVPEDRAEQERRSYAAALSSDLANLRALAGEDPAKLATLETEFQRYREGLKEHTIAYLRARSRCLSPMITGPAKFPTARNQKHGDVADKRLAEYTEWRARALAAIRRTLCPEDAPIRSGDEDAVERLREKIEAAEKVQARMVAANAAIRKHAKAGTEAQVAALVALGFHEAEARERLKPDFAGRVGFADYETRNNGANLRRMKERLAGLERDKATPAAEVVGDKARVEDVPADNRVRIFYLEKPDAETRTRLKRGGFRWTPSLGCWQAYRNPSTLALASREAGTCKEVDRATQG